MARRKDGDKTPQSKDDYDSNNEEVEEEPDFDDPEGFVDDISDEGKVPAIWRVSFVAHLVDI